MGMEHGELHGVKIEWSSGGHPNSIHSDHVLRTSGEDRTLNRVRASGCAPARLSDLAQPIEEEEEEAGARDSAPVYR